MAKQENTVICFEVGKKYQYGCVSITAISRTAKTVTFKHDEKGYTLKKKINILHDQVIRQDTFIPCEAVNFDFSKSVIFSDCNPYLLRACDWYRMPDAETTTPAPAPKATVEITITISVDGQNIQRPLRRDINGEYVTYKHNRLYVKQAEDGKYYPVYNTNAAATLPQATPVQPSLFDVMRSHFEGITNANELKAAYKKLALENHPDKGGSADAMAAINEEYRAKAAELARDKQEAANEANDFINIIEELAKIDGLSIELCGSWLWISGNTKEHRSELKELGCHYAPKKQMWNWHEGDGRRYRGKSTMGEIRFKYGSQKIKTASDDGKAITTAA